MLLSLKLSYGAATVSMCCRLQLLLQVLPPAHCRDMNGFGQVCDLLLEKLEDFGELCPTLCVLEWDYWMCLVYSKHWAYAGDILRQGDYPSGCLPRVSLRACTGCCVYVSCGWNTP